VFGVNNWLTTSEAQIDESDYTVAIGSKGLPIVDVALVPLELDSEGNFIAKVKGVNVRV
jgi:hypothetical protein